MVFASNELDMLVLQNGEDGIPADSKYIWVKYSQNANGVPLTDDPMGAVYIGIAYNKDSIEESNNPSDYSWSKILGDKGDDAYTIILSNENISFSVSYEDNLAIDDQSFTTDVRVFYGATERDDFVIGEIGSSNGITVSKTVNSVTLSVADNTKITAKHGYFRIPISIDGTIFYKDMSWNTVPQGVPGSVGQPALNISLGNESQNIPCNSEGITLESFLIEIPFAAYEGFNKVACTASVGVLPSGITLGQNTASTPDSDGLIILNVARGSNLGDNNVSQGKVVITFLVAESEVTKNFTWTKTRDGATGEAGQFTLYSLESSAQVISKTFDDTFSPESITFSAYSMEGNSGDKTEYSGMFIIEESTNGTTYDTSYLSSADEQFVVFTPTSIDVRSIRCTLYKAGGITSALDIYTIPVLTDVDNMRPIIDEITTTLSGVASDVDAVQKQITNKVWQSDITTQINNYDNSTIKTIRDQISQQTITIDGIESTVSDIESEFSSTTQTLSQRITQAQQTADKFNWLVKSNSSSSSLTLTDAAITAVSQQSIFKSPDGSATIIEGGRLKANSITADMIATGAITIGKFDSTTQGLINGAAKKIYHSTAGTSGTPGYFLLCTLKITQQYMDQPIIITVLNRGKMPSTVWIAFQNDEGTDPALNFIKKTGDANFYIVKLDTSTWQLYVQKSESDDNLSVTDFQVGSYASKITVTWETTQVSTLPTGYTTAIQMVGSSTWCYNNDLTYIDGGKIYTGTVTANQIAANAITAEKINSNAITADKIDTNAITSDKIVADAVTADKLNVSSLSAISANLGTITAGSINIGSGKFTVSSSGVLTATGATISGVITATSGKIGGLTLSSALYSGSHSTFASTADGVYLGTDGFSVGSSFRVTNAGALTANYVSLSGLTITRALDVNITENNSIRFNGTPLDSPNADDEWSNVIRLPGGTMIVTTWTQHQVSISTPWGSGYTSQQLSGASYGIAFKNKPLEFFMVSPVSTTTANVCSVMPMYNGTTSTCSSFYLFAPGSITNMQWYIKVIAIGRWK